MALNDKDKIELNLNYLAYSRYVSMAHTIFSTGIEAILAIILGSISLVFSLVETDYITEFNWNDSDKNRIKQEALKDIAVELKKPHFKDVRFPIEEVDKLIEEILTDILG